MQRVSVGTRASRLLLSLDLQSFSIRRLLRRRSFKIWSLRLIETAHVSAAIVGVLRQTPIIPMHSNTTPSCETHSRTRPALLPTVFRPPETRNTSSYFQLGMKAPEQTRSEPLRL